MINIDSLKSIMTSASLKEANSSNFKFVDINKIIENPFNDGRQNEENIQNIKESIEQAGLLNALIVVPEKDKYMLISGHARLKALKELNVYTFNGVAHYTDEVPVFINNSISSTLEKNLNVIRANGQKDETVEDKIETTKKVLEIYNIYRKDGRFTEKENKRHFISTITGYSESSVKNYLKAINNNDTQKSTTTKTEIVPTYDKFLKKFYSLIDYYNSLDVNIKEFKSSNNDEYKQFIQLLNYLNYLVDDK